MEALEWGWRWRSFRVRGEVKSVQLTSFSFFPDSRPFQLLSRRRRRDGEKRDTSLLRRLAQYFAHTRRFPLNRAYSSMNAPARFIEPLSALISTDWSAVTRERGKRRETRKRRERTIRDLPVVASARLQDVAAYRAGDELPRGVAQETKADN